MQLHFDLARVVDDNMMDQIGRVHGVYGILRVSLASSLDKLTVEYDATRLSVHEVETVLRKCGIPIALQV